MKTVGIYTLGCKVNTYESEYVISKLKEADYEIKEFSEKCDVYIINTCTVTNNSDSKSRKIIHQAIKNNKDACIIAMGCFIAANPDYRDPDIDIYIGNKDKSKIVDILNEYYNRKEIIIKETKERLHEFEDMYIDKFPGRTRAFVKIQDGCNNFCSYCIIPFVRGNPRSKKKERVLTEITNLVENGYKEIVLTGIHTGSYGVDIETSFAELLRDIIKIDGLKRLRISSIEVTELNEDVLSIIKDSKILVDHLHIPIQAGTDEILKRMNRKYDLKFYKNKIKEIRTIRPEISISTDIIVGFPGENIDLFKKSIEVCREIGFSKLHVFPYSERKGTLSSKMSDKINNETKKAHARELIEVSKELEIKYMKKYLHKDVEVLIEEYKDGYSYGHTGNYLHVKIKGNYPQNSFVNVIISDIVYPFCISE